MIEFIKWMIATLMLISLFSLLMFIIFILIEVTDYMSDNRIIANCLNKVFKGR